MFLLNLQSKVPIYEQIRSQIIRFIDAGALQPGDKLPSVRQLAIDNGINPNTVARAYAMLEEQGYVYNLPKKGVYIAEIRKNSGHEEMIREALTQLKKNGMTKEEILRITEELFAEE